MTFRIVFYPKMHFFCKEIEEKMNSEKEELKVSISNLREEAKNSIDISYYDSDAIIIDSIKDLSLPNSTAIIKDMIVIVICEMGKLQLDINGITHTLHQHDLLFCGHLNAIDNIMQSPDFECKVACLSYNIILRLTFVDRETWNKAFYLQHNPIIHLSPLDLVMFRKYYEVAKHKFEQPKHHYFKEALTGLLQAGLYDLLGTLEDLLPKTELNTVNRGSILCSKFLTLLNESQGKRHDVKYYADKLCITPKYLTTVCKKETGKNASKWIQDKTIESIQHLLKSSDKSISEISDYLDFPNLSFFGKYVKEHLGMSPNAYRKQLKNKE